MSGNGLEQTAKDMMDATTSAVVAGDSNLLNVTSIMETIGRVSGNQNLNLMI